MTASNASQRRRRLTPLQWLLYHYNRFVTLRLWRAKVSGPLPVEPGEGAVLIACHRSSLDPCVIQLAAGRRVVHWMVAQLYPEGSVIERILRQLEVIPVRKEGNDISPIKTAIRMAQQGHVIGMFPEGTVNTTENFMRPIRPGAVMVAIAGGVPVVPCYVEGVPYHKVPWRPLFMRGRVRVTMGEPIDLSEYHGQEHDSQLVAQLALDCVKEIAKLAGEKNFEPTIAGRDWKTWR